VSDLFLSASFLFLLVTNDRLYESSSFVCLSREIEANFSKSEEVRSLIWKEERRSLRIKSFLSVTMCELRTKELSYRCVKKMRC